MNVWSICEPRQPDSVSFSFLLWLKIPYFKTKCLSCHTSCNRLQWITTQLNVKIKFYRMSKAQQKPIVCIGLQNSHFFEVNTYNICICYRSTYINLWKVTIFCIQYIQLMNVFQYMLNSKILLVLRVQYEQKKRIFNCFVIFIKRTKILIWTYTIENSLFVCIEFQIFWNFIS